MAELPSIPSIPGNVDPALWTVLSAVKTNLDYLQANPATSNGVDQAQLEAAVANAVTGITQGQNGAPGEPGINGVNGKSYVLDIIGGRTSIIFDANGANPLPAMAAFSATLYEDGIEVTPTTYSWAVSDPANSMLSGTGSGSTFTPTVAGTFNQAKGNNAVVLVVSYGGYSIRATEPIAITKVGANGADGSSGVNGTRTAILDMYKLSVGAPTTFPSGTSLYYWSNGQFDAPAITNGWTLTPPAPETGKTLWIARTTYADTNSTATSNITWTATTASPLSTSGADGVNGTRTARMDVYKWAATAPTTFPSGTSLYTWSDATFAAPSNLNGWSLTPPAIVQGQTLWMARTVYADNGSSATTLITWDATSASPLAFAGLDGSGASNYLHIRYSNDGGATFTASSGETPGDYIGTYSDGNPADSDLVSAYTWARIKGTDGRRTAVLELYQWSIDAPTSFPVGTSEYTWNTGAFGLPATPNGWQLVPGTAEPGMTLYACSVVYSDTDNSATTTITWTATSAYAIGKAGTNGLNTAIIYAYQRSSTPLTSNPGDVVYTFATKAITTPATNALANGWTKAIPATGGDTLYVTAATASSANATDSIAAAEWSAPVALSTDGVPGDPGPDGATTYTWFAYANDATGSTGFTTGAWTNQKYLGIASNKPTATESTNPADYSWSLIQGLDGDPGNPGLNVATAILYQRTTSNTAPSAVASSLTFTFATGAITGTLGGWSASIPSSSSGKYLWITRATASNIGTTDTIAAGEWSSPTLYTKDASAYLLFITGGKTNAVYDTTGANPLPAPTAFSAELYEDGSIVTPDTYTWSAPASNSLLSGSSTTATFTPTLAASYDVNKGDNRVLLTCTYNGQTVKAVQPIVITKQASAGAVDTTPPNACDNLVVTGGVLYNFVTFDFPSVGAGNIDHIEIYRAATDDRSTATVIGSTKVKMYVDYIPDGVNTAYYYWLRAVSKAGILGDWNLLNGVVSADGTSATPLAIGDSQVGTISASKIFAVNLNSFTADLGTVTAGVIRSADSSFSIDLSDKSITIAGPAGLLADDYTLIKNGKIDFWKWTGSAHQQGNSLQTIESGTVSNDSVVTLSKWYASIPNIIVTPNDTPIYNATYSGQSQKLQVRAENVAITGGGSVSFKAVSRLVLSGSNPLSVVNDAYSGSGDTDVTATRTTDANTTKIDVNLSFSSKRGTGTSPNFYYRKVDARIAYRTAGSGGAFTFTSWTTTNIGADFNTYTASLTSGTIASGTYDFYVEFLSADRGGTFASGAPAYEQLPGGYADVALASNSAMATLSPGNNPESATVQATFPAYSPPAGFTIYWVAWTINYGRYLKKTGTSGQAYARTRDPRTTVTIDSQTSAGETGVNNVPAATSVMSYTTSSYSQTQSVVIIEARSYIPGVSTPSSYGDADARAFASGSYARIYAQKPAANVTTPENVFTFISYSLTLSSATVIDSTGTLNWMAIA